MQYKTHNSSELVNSQYLKSVSKMSPKRSSFLATQKDFQDFCHLPIFLLSSIGYDFKNKTRPIWLVILGKCYFLFANMSHLYVFRYIAKATFNMIISTDFELSLLLRLISGFNYAVFSTVKFMAFHWYRKELINIYETLEEIFPKTHKEKLLYRVRDHFWPKWILFIVYFYVGAVAFIATSPLMEGIVLYLANVSKVGWRLAEFGYFKLYEIEYGFDHHSTFSYLITYSMELMHAHYMVMCNLCADIWLLCFALQLCMHFDYVARSLENYEPNEQEFVKDQEFIAELVKRHQILLNIGDGLNSVFGVLLLLLLMATAATLCCAGIYTLTQDLGREFIEYVAFLPTTVGQYYLICYYGQQLIIRSNSVTDAAYNHSWYNASKSYKKSIFIIIMRSQKGVELNAVGLQPICLEAFKMLMGATYRVFALLKETTL
ncbi:odorant receptor 85f [Calliphora vicina]|uniref:odorant receptor 85f n=1 Tax=Calliphora vicina TaxID=7373 RepID=UPI00325B0A4A